VALLKNTASQKIAVKALDAAGEAVLDNETFITCKVAIDHGTATALTDTNPTETEDGVYLFDVTQAETNGNHLLFYPESSTADVVVIVLDGANGHTLPPNFSALGIASDGDLVKVNTLDGHTPQTGDSFARIGAAGAGLTALPWNNAVWDDEVQSEVADGLNAYFPTLNANMATVVSQTAAINIRFAVGLASANLDTQLGNIVTDTAEIGAAGAGLTSIPGMLKTGVDYAMTFDGTDTISFTVA
jgi:hypothetical protein